MLNKFTTVRNNDDELKNIEELSGQVTNDILGRFKKFIEETRMSQSEFAKQVGVSRQSVNNVTSGRNQVSIELVVRVSLAFPSLNLHWLFTGVGEMKVNRKSLEDNDLKLLAEKLEPYLKDIYQKKQ